MRKVPPGGRPGGSSKRRRPRLRAIVPLPSHAVHFAGVRPSPPQSPHVVGRPRKNGNNPSEERTCPEPPQLPHETAVPFEPEPVQTPQYSVRVSCNSI